MCVCEVRHGAVAISNNIVSFNSRLVLAHISDMDLSVRKLVDHIFFLVAITTKNILSGVDKEFSTRVIVRLISRAVGMCHEISV